MSNMRLVRCIEERHTNPEQITKGKLYWIDDITRYRDFDGDEYGKIYLDEEKSCYIGNLKTSHFKIVHRYLRYGFSPFSDACSDSGNLLEDILY